MYKKQSKLFLLFLLIGALNTSFICKASNTNYDNHKIIFDATIYDIIINPSWLNSIKNNWNATGVLLCISWGSHEVSPNNFNWDQLDQAINSINNVGGLDIYVRIGLGVFKPSWVQPGNLDLINDDFQTTKNGLLFKYNNDPNRCYPLNFRSTKALNYMKRFFEQTVIHLSTKYGTKIKEVIPSVTPEDEMEYPHNALCGFSNIEITDFRAYLKNKYSTIQYLNNNWNSAFIDFNSIDPKTTDWDMLNTTTYPRGKMDWMKWRTQSLKLLIDDFASFTHKYNYAFGLQVGSIYDDLIEKRGWYDIAPLLENVDALHVADINLYKDNFNFSADYAKSLCNYWSFIKNKKITFTTETNWPGFQGQSAALLCEDWIQQLKTYYNKGAGALFIYGWAKPDKDYSIDSYLTYYKAWQDCLYAYKNKAITSPTSSKVIHLGCESACYSNNNLATLVKPVGNYATNGGNYDNNCDIITNFMIEKKYEYLNKYSVLNFTKSSIYVSDLAYLNLMRNDLTINMDNVTWYSYYGHGQFDATAGLRNEYNDLRSPIHLIWRTRNDLKQIFPDANIPGSNAPKFNWPANDPNMDFVFWVNTYGKTEYPGVNFLDGNRLYNYDKNIRCVWNIRPDLQKIFTDGHYTRDHKWNIISWSKQYGYKEINTLATYQFWPYIGSAASLQKVKMNNLDSLVNSKVTNDSNQPNQIELYPTICKNGDQISILLKNSIQSLSYPIDLIDEQGRIITTLHLSNNEINYISFNFPHSGIYILCGEGIKPKKIVVI